MNKVHFEFLVGLTIMLIIGRISYFFAGGATISNEVAVITAFALTYCSREGSK